VVRWKLDVQASLATSPDGSVLSRLESCRRSGGGYEFEVRELEGRGETLVLVSVDREGIPNFAEFNGYTQDSADRSRFKLDHRKTLVYVDANTANLNESGSKGVLVFRKQAERRLKLFSEDAWDAIENDPSPQRIGTALTTYDMVSIPFQTDLKVRRLTNYYEERILWFRTLTTPPPLGGTDPAKVADQLQAEYNGYKRILRVLEAYRRAREMFELRFAPGYMGQQIREALDRGPKD